MSIPPCWSVLSSWQFSTTNWERLLRRKNWRSCKGCGCTVWHKQGQQAERFVMLTGVWALQLTSNYRQTFFSSTTSWGDNRHSIRGWGSHSSITSNAIFLTNRKNWLQANNLSLAYHWAEVKAMAFCWITFPLINDTVSEKISPGEWRGDSISIMMVLMDDPNASLCQDSSDIHQNVERI